jgi:tetratricopeptide (TPR) repeat protein
MLLSWLNAREATDLGRSLADHFDPHAGSEPAARGKKALPSGEKATHAFLQQVDREARPLRLSFYKRAKLANSFKWRLLERGVEQGRASELTQLLLLQLSANGASAVQAHASVTPTPKRSNAGKVDSLLLQAIECDAQGSHAEAVRLYQALLELDPRQALAHNNLGAALCKLGRYQEAEQAFRRTIEIKPDYPDALCNLGTVLRWRGLILESEMPLRRAVKLSPRHVAAQNSLAATLVLLGRLPDARSRFEKALKLAPRSVDALIGLGTVAGIEGRIENAEALFMRALEVDPKAPAAWAALPRVRKMSHADAAWLNGAQSVAASSLAPLDESSVRFAIGKYHDDVGNYEHAFRSYQRANELLKTAAQPYDRHQRVSFVNDIAGVYTREALSRAGLGASDSERPVFVVGMMRSGTSLVEQIIASHADAKGAGELDFWATTVRKHQDILRHALPDESLKRKWAEAYLRTLQGYSRDALRVVDKLPVNSDHLGVIRSVFPRARILYVRRDPIDTCLSCYFQQFAPSLNFTMDLSDLAHYYREHRRLVNHWHTVLAPERFLEVPYAELVSDQEKWTRKILDFLGLAWDPRCLDFQKTQRTVLTASSWQVRQKIYQSSVGRWRSYEKFIGPLLELADAA